MRYLIVLIVYALLGNPMGASAQTTSTDTSPGALKGDATSMGETHHGCQQSELALVGKKEGTDVRFKMGDSLRIKATGECFDLIQTELAKAEASKVFTLYLDDVRMVNLPVHMPEISGEKTLTLTFQLTRKAQEDDNRKAWDTFLEKQQGQHRGRYVMTPPVALGIGNELARSVQSVPPFQFYIAEDAAVWGTLVVCVVMFLGAYYLLVKKTAALRDAKTGYYSLGKSQMAFWGLMVVLTFAGIWFVTGTMERIPLQVLMLIGISGGTALSAIVIGENKTSAKQAVLQSEITTLQAEQQTLEKEKLSAAAAFPPANEARLGEIRSKIDELSKEPVSAPSAGFWQDICDDGNGLSFHRLQVVIWTAVLGVVFVGSVSRTMSMPEFSDTLLTLLGISNGTYLGFKIPEKA